MIDVNPHVNVFLSSLVEKPFLDKVVVQDPDLPVDHLFAA